MGFGGRESKGRTRVAHNLDNALWQFSLRVYSDAEVERACLRLQDEHRADVTLILFCCWFGASGYGRIEEAHLHELLALTRRWSEKSVYPLRALRRQLKDDPSPVSRDLAEATRQQVLAAEIEAERALQGLLFEAVRDLGARSLSAGSQADDARANIAVYLGAAGIAGGEVVRQIETIIDAAVSALSERD